MAAVVAREAINRLDKLFHQPLRGDKLFLEAVIVCGPRCGLATNGTHYTFSLPTLRCPSENAPANSPVGVSPITKERPIA